MDPGVEHLLGWISSRPERFPCFDGMKPPEERSQSVGETDVFSPSRLAAGSAAERKMASCFWSAQQAFNPGLCTQFVGGNKASPDGVNEYRLEAYATLLFGASSDSLRSCSKTITAAA